MEKDSANIIISDDEIPANNELISPMTMDYCGDTDGEVAVEDYDDDMSSASMSHSGGRTKSSIWSYFTDTNYPQKLKSDVCKHCKTLVNYQRKSERVKSHLQYCKSFEAAIRRGAYDRPDWYHKIKNFTFDLCSKATIPADSECSSTKSSRSASLKDFLIPAINAVEEKKIHRNIAMFFYKTGTSFVRVEDENLLKAFTICRPGVKLPSRKQLAGGLLDECYDEVQQQLTNHLSTTAAVCIISDAWTNIMGEPVINYMASTPTKTLFIESVSTGDQSHNAQWIAQDLSRVIDKFPCSVVGAVTDNTATNKRAWKILEEKYPDKFFHGCASHGLNLLVKDIFYEGKSRSRTNPFEYLSKFASDCKDIVSFFKNHHALHHVVVSAQKEKGLKALALPAPHAGPHCLVVLHHSLVLKKFYSRWSMLAILFRVRQVIRRKIV